MSKAASSSKADTAVKLVLIFFISLLSFSVGTYVGKQVSESEARQAALEADYNNYDGQAAAHHEEGNEATAPISEAESNSLAEEFVKGARKVASEDGHGDKAEHGDGHSDKHAAKDDHDDGHGDATNNSAKDAHAAKDDHGDGHGVKEAHGAAAKDGHGEAAKNSEAKKDDGYTHHTKMKMDSREEASAGHGAKEDHGDDGHGEKAAHGGGHGASDRHTAAVEKAAPAKPSAAAERVSHDMAPAADPVKKPEGQKHLPTVATTAIGKYTVQVASYASEDEAKNHVAKLSNKGYSPFYVRADVNGKSWYRVSIGLFSDQKSATNYRTELLATQAVSSAIVQKIVK